MYVSVPIMLLALAGATPPQSCALRVINRTRAAISLSLSDGRTHVVPGFHKLPTVVRHENGGTTTTGGWAGGTWTTTVKPGSSIAALGEQETVGPDCDLVRNGRSFGDLQVLTYDPRERYTGLQVKYSDDHGRSYISEEIDGNHHIYYDTHGTVIRDVKIDPSLP